MRIADPQHWTTHEESNVDVVIKYNCTLYSCRKEELLRHSPRDNLSADLRLNINDDLYFTLFHGYIHFMACT